MISRFCAALLLAAAATVPAIAGAIYTPAGANYPWEARRAHMYLRFYSRANNFAGTIFMVRGNKLLAQRAFGLENVAHGDPDSIVTRFHVAGVSKTFTAAAILLLEQDGKLRTSDPVSQFVPGYAGGATVDALLAHNANADYDVLAQVVEKASGQHYADFVQQRIFAPLHMSHSNVDTGAADSIGHVASGTEPVGLHDVRDVADDEWREHQGSLGVVTTAPEMCTFTQALWSRGLLSQASLAKMKAVASTGTGYGWIGREHGGHWALGADGHAPGFGASLDYFVESDTCIALLSNIGTYFAQVAMPDMATIAFGSAAAWPEMGYEPAPKGALAAFTGTYRMPANFIVPNETVKLTIQDTYLEANWSGGITTILYPVEGDKFVDRNAWGQVRFKHDASGKVIGFDYDVVHAFTAQRVQ